MAIQRKVRRKKKYNHNSKKMQTNATAEYKIYATEINIIPVWRLEHLSASSSTSEQARSAIAAPITNIIKFRIPIPKAPNKVK